MANLVLVASIVFARNDMAKKYLEEQGLNYVLNPNPKKIELPYGARDEICAVVLGDQKFGKEQFELMPHLKTIARIGTGYDNVDMEEAKRRGVIVTRTAGLNAVAVADLALGLIIALSRNIVLTHGELAYNNRWFRKPGKMLCELTVGIIGLGHIGRALVMKLDLLGVNEILAFNRSWGEDITQFAKDHHVILVNHEAVLHSSDLVVVCLALDKKEKGGTNHLISRDLLQLMKPEACLINVGRGATVDEEALCELLERDKIGGAALDVYSQEPPTDSDLFKRFQMLGKRGKNVILTPHMGSLAESIGEQIAMAVAHNIVSVLFGNLENAEIIAS